jgi:uncharacterized protein
LGGFDMHVDLSQLEADELHIEHQYREPFDLPEQDVTVALAPAIELWLRRTTGREVRVKGNIAATVEVPCDRCLVAFSVPVGVSFDLFYAPIETLAPEEDVPLTEKDLDYGFYRDNLLDVDALVREQIFLSLPFRRLCRSDCRGLCPQCGTDLNKEMCSCQADTVSSRWSALRDLKKMNH